MPNPITRFRSWHRAAAKAGAPLPEAMVLATADRRGRPSARYVLLKDATERGFVFYTNANSRKGDDMRENAHVALAFYWNETGKQVRVEGKVRVLPAVEADQYWSERPIGSRYASAASQQSSLIDSRAELLRRYRELEAEYPDGDIPRPAHWIGFLVVPDAIEFWTRAEPRLHKRELFRRVRGAKRKLTTGAKGQSARAKRDVPATQWTSQLLQP